ncbi:MAG: CBS domain-containing protein [Anaerosomatales bacterium]|nr:CBS domain-containing protein [Anaerosomatales bacterium]MDT8433487.1 CBS domain-containing protein [Anaerosomatales bacterium]
MELVVGHANPDFDAYAATAAATKLFPGSRGVFLGTQNSNVRAFHNLHEDFLEFVDLRGLDLDSVTRLIVVDTRDAGRIGELGEVALRPDVDVIVYDHHPPAEGDLEGVDDRSLEVGATTSILVHEIHRQGIALTPLEASLLLLGVHEDTGSLTYPGTTAYDAEAVAYLMGAGADMEVLNQFLSRALDAEQLRLLEDLVGSLEVWDVHGQQVAVGVARAEEYVDSASVLTHYIVEDMGYRVAIAIVGMPGRLQLVARSRLHEVDVGEVMKRIGGGGHAQAASAAFRELDTEAALLHVREALEQVVRPPLKAKDILSAPVHTVQPDATMAEAATLMSSWGHGGLPVVEDDRIVGLVTRKDVDKAVRHRLSHAPVKGFMTREVVTVAPGDDLYTLENLLAAKGIGRLPVVSDGALVGIVTRKDLLAAQHGDEYLDRRLPRARARSTERFLASVTSLLPEEAHEALHEIGRLAEEHGLRAHAVGGFVRDMLLGRRNLDVDIVVEGDGVAFAQAAAEALGARVKVHRRFGTAVLVLSKTLHLDITSARTEYYTRPGALPTVERSSLRQDLFRRDFTVNAMAACVNAECFGAVADPFGGLRDLERGTLRVLHPLSFVEDPTRVLRAARFERRFGFSMDGATEDLARQAVEIGVIDEVSGARIREEMLDIIDEDAPSAVCERLDDLGVLGVLLPEGVAAHQAIEALFGAERAYRTLADAFERAPRRSVSLVAALVADSGRQAGERWLRRMRFGREYAESALVLAERSAFLGKRLKDRRKMRDSRLYRLLEPVPQEALVHLWASGDALARERVQRFVSVLSRIKPAVTGEDLIEMGLTPSPAFSGILAQALDARLDGKAVGREAEMANLGRLVSRAGLSADNPQQGR